MAVLSIDCVILLDGETKWTETVGMRLCAIGKAATAGGGGPGYTLAQDVV
jgi:hypothetical protein